MAVLYTVLSEADASKQPDQEKKPLPKKPANVAKAAPKSKAPPPPEPGQSSAAKPGKPDGGPKDPDLNINLQIHISADASADQIEQIFASMAKHIYRRAQGTK
ncbi:MAG: hypothetical protein LAO55_23720 [Acidobacteriia bacterium]|nr:hypothetical protein [Terriglobia bacterium]